MGLKYSDRLEFGYVYKIECNKSGMVYYGSTTKTIDHRMKKHIERYNAYLGDYTRKKSGAYEIFKLCDYRVEVLEILFDLNYKELLEREAYYIKNYECINLVVPLRTDKEWRDENKMKIREIKKHVFM